MSDRVTHWPQRLELDPSVFLAPGAIVTGEVALGARVSVWFHTVIRGDTDRIEVGEDTNLQDLTMVHVDHGEPAVIGRRVTVGHRAIIHGCRIEDDCLIGMGAIVLSGARVGAGCLIGAGALVREGQVIPPGCLALGAPARVLGPVNDAHRAAIADGTKHYVALSREYLARGFGQRLPVAGDPRGALGLPPLPMGFDEWARLLATLAEAPGWTRAALDRQGEEAFARRPGPERWSAAEVAAHLYDADAEVFELRLDRLLTETMPQFVAADLVSRRHGVPHPTEPTRAVLERWAPLRKRLVARLEGLGHDHWRRLGVHAIGGPYSVADMVRSWVDHDLSHRLQSRRALGECS